MIMNSTGFVWASKFMLIRDDLPKWSEKISSPQRLVNGWLAVFLEISNSK